MEHKYIECDCGSSEHTIRFTPDSDDVYPNIYVSFQLNPRFGFWKRIWIAIKYIFGYQCQWGHWDEAMLTGPEVKKLRELCDLHLKDWEKYMEDWENKDGSGLTTEEVKAIVYRKLDKE